MNPKVDVFLANARKWKEEMTLLRSIILESGLIEDYKWMHPCYTFQGKNVVLIHGFKEYCALLFHKGALLKDAESVLIQQTENVQSARQIRFSCIEQVKELESVIKTYVKEAIEIEKTGKKVILRKTSDYPVPEEFQKKLDESPDLRKAFNDLTPGRQRAYLFYFSQAKQSRTRESRVEICLSKILDGKGLDD